MSGNQPGPSLPPLFGFIKALLNWTTPDRQDAAERISGDISTTKAPNTPQSEQEVLQISGSDEVTRLASQSVAVDNRTVQKGILSLEDIGNVWNSIEESFTNPQKRESNKSTERGGIIIKTAYAQRLEQAGIVFETGGRRVVEWPQHSEGPRNIMPGSTVSFDEIEGFDEISAASDIDIKDLPEGQFKASQFSQNVDNPQSVGEGSEGTPQNSRSGPKLG